MRVTREYKTRTRLGARTSITFVPLWYKDTDAIKNGFHPTTCRGTSIKAKQMKFFIDAFWIPEPEAVTEFRRYIYCTFYRFPSKSFSFNDASGHPLDSFPYFYRPISFSSLLRKMFWNNYIRNFVDLFVRKTVNRFNFVHSILPYLQIFLPLICLNKQTFIFRFESVQRQFVTITANFARFR